MVIPRLDPAHVDPPAPDTPLADAALADLLAAAGADGVPAAVWERALHGPARAFLARPGKAFRARLVEAGWALSGGAPAGPPPALGAAIELLHAGSLIVDDVQDDSATRRGAPALHLLVGAPLAVNTGGWMYFRALELLGEAPLPPAAAATLLPRVARTLADCHRGQALDLATRVFDLDRADVPAVVAATTALKTGALMALAAQLGALAAGAPPALVAALATAGRDLGVALQMLDDLGGLTAPSRRDKGREDLAQGRPTWPWAWLARAADDVTWARLQRQARAAATSPPDRDALADTLAARVQATGRADVRARLSTTFATLADAVARDGAPAALDPLRREIARLEASYG